MKQHTKGPWALDGDIGAMNLDVVYGSGRIAMIECENDEVTDAELLSNARLIAAAPELLAALEQCLPIIDAHRRTALGEGDIAAMNARAAIAKAKGGA